MDHRRYSAKNSKKNGKKTRKNSKKTRKNAYFLQKKHALYTRMISMLYLPKMKNYMKQRPGRCFFMRPCAP